MTKRTVVLSVDTDLYAEYSEYCKKEGLIKSRQFERLMERTLLSK